MRYFKTIRKLKEHPISKNKNLSAVLITEENVNEISEITKGVFIPLNDNKVITTGTGFYKLPQWIICLNPKSKSGKRYIIESDGIFQKYFEVIDDTEWKEQEE